MIAEPQKADAGPNLCNPRWAALAALPVASGQISSSTDRRHGQCAAQLVFSLDRHARQPELSFSWHWSSCRSADALRELPGGAHNLRARGPRVTVYFFIYKDSISGIFDNCRFWLQEDFAHVESSIFAARILARRLPNSQIGRLELFCTTAMSSKGVVVQIGVTHHHLVVLFPLSLPLSLMSLILLFLSFSLSPHLSFVPSLSPSLSVSLSGCVSFCNRH